MARRAGMEYSSFTRSVHGKEKSPAYKKYRQEILNAKSKGELEKLIQVINILQKKGKISMDEMQDLVNKILDKIDKKSMRESVVIKIDRMLIG